MTRRGSLAYYLASWAFGCLFLTLCFAAVPVSSRFPAGLILGMLYFYFLALPLGAFTTLLFGFLLRRVASVSRFLRAWQWILAGGVIAPTLVFALGAPIAARFRWPAFLHSLPFYLLYAPEFIRSGGVQFLWRTALAGAATGWVLFRVQRAFVLSTTERSVSDGEN